MFQTPAETARKSAPASISGFAFSTVMPPMATPGTTIISAHQRSNSMSALGLRLFGRGRKERAERDIVGARFGGLDREMARIVAGDADDASGPTARARLGIGRVVLADMHAVAAQFAPQDRAGRSG